MTAPCRHICTLLCLAWLALFTSCENGTSDPKIPQIYGDTLLVDVSGQSYKIKRFGSTLWMMENYRSTQDTRYIYIYDAIHPLDESKTPYYGYLYNYQTAKELMPQGWQLPSEADVDSLLSYLGGSRPRAGAFLKGDEDWTLKSDSSIMSYAPAGLAKAVTHDRAGYGTECYFWLSNVQEKLGAMAAKMTDSSQVLSTAYYNDVEEYMTVRYVMYSPQPDEVSVWSGEEGN